MSWIGRKKLAFIPLYRPNAHPPDQIPTDWNNQILQRVLLDPDPKTGVDQSLRAYIRAASSGVADFDPVVFPMQMIDEQDVQLRDLDAQLPQLRSQLNAEGFDAAAIVMLGGPGAGTSQRGGFWARFVMAESVGVWAMEFMHCLTGFGDLYTLPGYADNPLGDMRAFDEMACSCGTHPSAFTKAAIQWLDSSAIAHHNGGAGGYDLYSVGLVQPPPSGRVTAVQIGSQVPYLMVEARQRVDQFDDNIPSEGAIVYRVQTSDPHGLAQNNIIPIFLLTTTALTPGMAYTSDSGVTVRVTSALPGGYSVVIDTPDPNAIPWTSVAEGQSTPGAPITAVVTGPDRVTLFLADPNGGIYTASGNANTGWGQWSPVAEGQSTPGAPITAVVTGPDRVTLFLADPNGGIYTASGNANTGWGQWTSVAEGQSTPGAPITAVVTGPDRVTLFLADPNGGIYTASGNANTGWGQWTSVAEGQSTPGAPITAVVTGPDRVTLFLADPNGGIYTASGNANTGWGQWSPVAEGQSTPGAPITAVVTGPDRVTLFLADPNGGIYTASGNANTGWGQWSPVAEGQSTPGAPITAVVTGPDRVTLFLADPNGGIYTASGNANTGWGQWTSVAEGQSTPGAPVTGVVTGSDRATLFLADRNGGVYTTTKKF